MIQLQKTVNLERTSSVKQQDTETTSGSSAESFLQILNELGLNGQEKEQSHPELPAEMLMSAIPQILPYTQFSGYAPEETINLRAFQSTQMKSGAPESVNAVSQPAALGEPSLAQFKPDEDFLRQVMQNGVVQNKASEKIAAKDTIGLDAASLMPTDDQVIASQKDPHSAPVEIGQFNDVEPELEPQPVPEKIFVQTDAGEGGGSLNQIELPQVNVSSGINSFTVQAGNFEKEINQLLQAFVQSYGAGEPAGAGNASLIMKNVENGTEATITLTPEHLGEIEVKVKIHEGQLKAEFLATTTQGRELLESHVSTLRSALEFQGLQVSKIDILQQPGNPAFAGAFSHNGDRGGRQGQQEQRKRSGEQTLITKESRSGYAYETEWVSQINTTA